VDLLRVSALGVVVLGHWLVVDVVHRDGHIDGRNALGEISYAAWLTLLFQAMPVFFLAGGYANATSWSAHRDRSAGWTGWVQSRVAGLAWPTAAYVLVMTAVLVVAGAAGADEATLSRAGWLVALHLWFLAVYLVLLVLAPLQVALHRRWGLVVPAALAAAVAVVDGAVLAGSLAAVGWASYVLVWGFVHQLGVAWQHGALTRLRGLPVSLAAVALLALAGLVRFGPYPVSMVGVPGADVQNTSPPSLALLAFAVAQVGLLVAVARPVTRWLADPRRWERVRRANRLALTVYLWHMAPVLLIAVAVYPTGRVPQPDPGSASWWLGRLAWVSVLATVLAGLVLAQRPLLPALRRLPTSVGPGRPVGQVLVVAGATLLVVALVRLAVDGLHPDGAPAWPALLAYAGGLALVLLAGPGTGARRPVAALRRR
jgi:hypothetical protein